MTITEHIRGRLLYAVPEPNKFKFTSIEDLEKSQWCRLFLRLMKNRMVLGAFRYGKLSSQKSATGPKYDNISSIHKRLTLYEITGNTEHLVDCGNLCMIEFMIGEHPNKHFESIDDGVHTEVKK